MTEFKPGDRVKVEYEGRVVRYERDGFYTVYSDYSGEVYYHENYLTLLGPEEPTGVGAVVSVANNLYFNCGKVSLYRWLRVASDTQATQTWSELCKNGPVEVLFEGVQP